MKPIIEIRSLNKSYEDYQVLYNLSLKIWPGELICVIGPSGCGKSTLLNLIGGFVKGDQGEILLNGLLVEKPSRKCIMVFQEFDQLFSWQTVRHNIEFPLKKAPDRLTNQEIRTRVNHYLAMVNLSDFGDYYPNQLSGGMKQRTALARALALSPQLLLMDEPFGSLDAQTKRDLQDTLLKIKEKTRATTVFVTHDIREALYLADRIVVLRAGTVAAVIKNQSRNVSETRVAEITALLSP
ncbi:MULTISPECIES: ABC transporter ATP-binding protein [unclassified Acetobacterium]|jgi:NitT/TauT family transport system ATP-binding protein|uniref:ABC transporter ATP-binding protein n=1 Tax=unclassified Acetobacterium TaxID=2638182 RepID=UPI001FA8FDC1|nr:MULTISPECIES: ABC transporter ATP-binding protein [unclassified Acetobacterium]MDZ5725856.1 ABC transporter ATP-binding protein [Acetobacterium sp. K1/6]